MAGLTFAATDVGSAASSVQPAAVVEILVNGAPVQRYAHGGRWYIEALEGREYAIQLRNPHAVRVAVALSVDGLNTIDARTTTAVSARKWVLDPFQTVVISGWQTSRSEARRFEFTTEAQSYGQALGKAENLGVITAVFYKERPRATSQQLPRERPADAPPAPAASAESLAAAKGDQRGLSEYAATGMGRPTGHAVTEVSLDLERLRAQTVNIRYEFRPQLVRLGILPADDAGGLRRREQSRGFEPGFAPVPPQLR
jgi:hypothetical protein